LNEINELQKKGASLQGDQLCSYAKINALMKKADFWSISSFLEQICITHHCLSKAHLELEFGNIA